MGHPITHAAGGMFVDLRAAKMQCTPVKYAAESGIASVSVTRSSTFMSRQKNRHRERGDLRVADAAVADIGDDGAYFSRLSAAPPRFLRMIF